MICATHEEILGLNIFYLIIALSLAAIIGNIFGYWFGYKIGPPLFKRKDSLIFKKKYLELTKSFYDKNGGKTLIIGRFIPIIRTFAPILAGVIKVEFKKFMLFNVVGALCWIIMLAGIGFKLGTYDWVQKNIGYIVLFLIIITLIPIIITYKKQKNP